MIKCRCKDTTCENQISFDLVNEVMIVTGSDRRLITFELDPNTAFDLIDDLKHYLLSRINA